jgi:hypothetical protein
MAELFDSKFKPSHIFALMLQLLGHRRLDLRDMESFHYAVCRVANDNEPFMKAFVVSGDHCLNLAGLVQQFKADGILVELEKGIYVVDRDELSAKLPKDTKPFKEFNGLGCLEAFSLPPVERPPTSQLIAAQCGA